MNQHDNQTGIRMTLYLFLLLNLLDSLLLGLLLSLLLLVATLEGSKELSKEGGTLRALLLLGLSSGLSLTCRKPLFKHGNLTVVITYGLSLLGGSSGGFLGLGSLCRSLSDRRLGSRNLNGNE